MDLRRRRFFFSTRKEPLDDVKSYRDKEDRDRGGSDHSTDDRRAEDSARDGTGPAGKPKRQKAEDECE